MTTTGGDSGYNFELLEGESSYCFLAGVLIDTPTGKVAVEQLKRDDFVITVDGQIRKIVWVGRQTVVRKFADPIRNFPIRVKANAISDNVPSRDLLLSPDHALLINEILVHAGALVNGISIVRESKVPERFSYFHVELEDHSLILAENTPAETFIDNVDRVAFDNWEEHLLLYPEGRPIEEMPYARAKSSRQVPQSLRARLLDRGQTLYGDANIDVA